MSTAPTNPVQPKESKSCKNCNCSVQWCSILKWENPVETGKIFGAILLSLIFIKKIQLIHVLKFFYSVIFTFSIVEYASKTLLYKNEGKGLITKFVAPKECLNVSGFLKPKIDQFLIDLPKWQYNARQILFASKPLESLKIASLVYIFTKILKVISLYSMIVTLVFLSFSLPLVYSKNQTAIDAQIKIGLDKYEKNQKIMIDKVESKLSTTPLGKYFKKHPEAKTTTTASTTATPSATTPSVQELNEKIDATTSGFEK
ncbi:hypothetical protein ACO0QE_002587 [Hanseniaspora vineae]